ncbi:hypothetical protein [Clostridium kluyveri]|uniref:Uncharacterized protein n=1 Tax=Clostridium kluyveri TaxID=1534 RepID=A0A1L5F2S5_CLOKL|nr:hypothetical protein [Clostridium kluyveri]APM37303.1 hypothetical protein BS101_00250 [Clostridium kluyveri]
MHLSDEARKAKAAYQREYRRQHKEQFNAYNRRWRAKNKDKVLRYNEAYWERKAKQSKKNDNSIELFIEEKCILQRDLSISNKQLVQSFNVWNGSNISNTKFSLEFKDIALLLGISKKRNKYGTIRQGVDIRL